MVIVLFIDLFMLSLIINLARCCLSHSHRYTEFQIWLAVNCGLLNRAWPTAAQVLGGGSPGDMVLEGNPLGVVKLTPA